MTHPFRPLAGRDFEFVAYRQNWGEDRVHLLRFSMSATPRSVRSSQSVMPVNDPGPTRFARRVAAELLR